MGTGLFVNGLDEVSVTHFVKPLYKVTLASMNTASLRRFTHGAGHPTGTRASLRRFTHGAGHPTGTRASLRRFTHGAGHPTGTRASLRRFTHGAGHPTGTRASLRRFTHGAGHPTGTRAAGVLEPPPEQRRRAPRTETLPGRRFDALAPWRAPRPDRLADLLAHSPHRPR